MYAIELLIDNAPCNPPMYCTGYNNTYRCPDDTEEVKNAIKFGTHQDATEWCERYLRAFWYRVVKLEGLTIALTIPFTSHSEVTMDYEGHMIQQRRYWYVECRLQHGTVYTRHSSRYSARVYAKQQRMKGLEVYIHRGTKQ